MTDSTAVIIDILRATSCWVTALANGAVSVHPVSTLEECKDLMQTGYIGAAERQGKQVAGFDAGNSPFDFPPEKVSGKKIAATTTNGSRTIMGLMTAKEVVVGSFLNFSSVKTCLEESENEIVLACSGWEGGISLEDMIFAGALLEKLERHYTPSGDAAITCLELWKSVQPGFRTWLRRSSHVQRLLKLGLEKDIDYCFSFDIFNIVPKLSGNEIIIPADLK
ncbi:MAG TPA: 2-phosphosulfolactate phosphatase [Cyclobacteriaceae bacterium]|nr:2-phosphosulfolactate phosphatase [Cyclobacteriaceae bacterium]